MPFLIFESEVLIMHSYLFPFGEGRTTFLKRLPLSILPAPFLLILTVM